MSTYEFYEIKSKKSLQFINGLRKVSLVCSGYPGAHIFIWLDQYEKVKHFQFLFDEKIIEWIEGQEKLITSRTNRGFIEPGKTGIMKGVRTIHAVNDNDVTNEGLTIISQSTFPYKYEGAIKKILGLVEA